MSYSFAQITAGQNAVNIFVSEYNRFYPDSKIDSADVLLAAKKYEDKLFLGNLGAMIEIAQENDPERIFESMSSLAKWSVFVLPSADSFIQIVKSNQVSDLEIITREIPKAIPQIKIGLYVVLGVLFLALFFIAYSRTKQLAGV